MKTALILGGSGLLGRGIAREFLGEGWGVSILSRGERPLPRDLSVCTQLTANRKDRGQLSRVLRVTTRAYYQCLAEIAGAELKFRPVEPESFIAEHPGQAHLARHRIYDTRPLEQLGFSPSLSLRDALQETLKPWL